MSRITFFLLAALLVSGEALGKCGNLIIHITGSIDGITGDDLRIMAQVMPPSNWEPQPEIPIKGGRFAGMVLFDRTKSEGRAKDDCSRAPDSLDVVLLRNDQELSRLRLDITKDFVREKTGDYKLRTPIVLRSR
jgi:hypothetical protein